MVDIFKALSEESRLRILSLLMDREMCVCEIESCLKMSQSNASRHLMALRNCGILSSYKKAQWAYYKIDESFVSKNADLWKFLQINLRELPTYQEDYRQSEFCRGQDCCNT